MPVIWLWIVGSRPVSAWLGIGPSDQGISQQLDGSPTDAFFFLTLEAAALAVLFRRKNRTIAFLRASAPIVAYFTYCLLSVVWAPYQVVALKRWIKDLGDLAMVLVVVTDADPIGAIRQLLSRVGFVLLPASILLIKYSDLGHQIDQWGNYTNIGVTTNKNTLGLITFVLSIGAVWRVCTLLRVGRGPTRKRRLLAQGTLLAFGVAVLMMAHSATSGACLTLGSALILATGLPAIRNRPSAVHALVLALLFAGGIAILFGGEGAAAHALGRQADFTGRTDIWRAVIPMVPNQVLGAGFESFWISPNLDKLWRSLSGWDHVEGLNSAHNGYIEIYLNLGWVGVILLALVLIAGYRRAVAVFRRDPALGGLMLAYVATAAIYNVTEAGFRMLTPTWIFLLLAVVASSGNAAGLIKSGPQGTRATRNRRNASKLAKGNSAVLGELQVVEVVDSSLPNARNL